MKDGPVIFSGPMVRALLADRKTMTRRILKPQPEPFAVDVGKQCDVGLLHVDGDPKPRITLGRVVTKQDLRYAIGDRLWVRENFAHVGTCDPGFLTYQATYPGDLAGYGIENAPATLRETGYKWKPSIHLPRALSRLTLAVTGLKVERLQDISEADAEAEGVYSGEEGDLGPLDISARALFADLWRSIHGTQSAADNPFVVAVTFRVVKANIDAPEARRAA